MRRRTFLKTLGGAAAAPALVGAAAGGAIPLGYDTYSIRDYRWKAMQHLDHAAWLKLDTIQISSSGDYESLEPAHLQKVKDHAARLGLSIDAGIGCICPTSSAWSPRNGDPAENVMAGLRVAKAVGSKSMRCFMGSSADRLGKAGPIERHIESTIKVFRTVRSQALDTGVKIALENHSGDMQAHEMLTIIQESGKDLVGACLDNGNAIWALEDPMVTLEVLGPYTVTTHIRDAVIFEHPRGAAAQWVAIGEGSLDFDPFMKRYREICPQAPMQLEIITGRAPRILPYFEPDFWAAYPKAKASEFVRFVQLAKQGHPLMAPMLIPPAIKATDAVREAMKEQQKLDLERSLEFCKKKLDVGNRWRS